MCLLILLSAKEIEHAHLKRTEDMGTALNTFKSFKQYLNKNRRAVLASLSPRGWCAARKQDPELRKKFTGQPEHLINFLFMVAEDFCFPVSALVAGCCWFATSFDGCGTGRKHVRSWHLWVSRSSLNSLAAQTC